MPWMRLDEAGQGKARRGCSWLTLTTHNVADGGRVGEGVEDEFLGDLGRVWQFFDIHHVGERGRRGERLRVLGRYCAATAEDCVS